MIIDRLGGIDPLKNIQSSQKTTQRNSFGAGKDSIAVSLEAKEMAQVYYAAEVASTTPDVRADRIAQVKEKIKDPNYINKTVINTVADRLMDSFGV